jgi:subtilisin family serine protease
METKEYIVSLKEGVNYSQFWQEIESGVSASPFLPRRQVLIVNERPVMERICNYALTDAEAEQLRQDPRVAGVEVPIEQVPGIIISFSAVQNSNFTKTTYTGLVNHSGTNNNWGLIRHSNTVNNYGTGKTTNQTYNYNLDGSGIDVVIADTGIEPTHPEFTFLGNTTSRVVQYNWTGNLDCSIGSTDFLDNESTGHGTHVAGVVAGKTYGWAKNAMIYPMKLPLAGVVGSKIPLDSAADLIKAWHIRKNTPGDAIYTGRPTVVNFSLASQINYTNLPISAIGYRGTEISATKPDETKGMLTTVKGTVQDNGTFPGTPVLVPYRSVGFDTATEELITAGIVICKAAGNNGYKIDTPGGIDYDNYFKSSLTGNTKYYYHRGSSPTSNTAITVGTIAGYGSAYNQVQEEKMNFSCGGPGVDIYAAGTLIRSATGNVNTKSSAEYFNNTNYRQATLSGTSQACPQVAGMAALYLQAHPTATPAQVKQWLISQTDPNSLYTTNKNNDYTVTNSQLGGSAGVALAPLGVINVKDSGNRWANVANVYVKSTSNTWAPVKTVWVKVDDSTWRPAC